MQTLGMDMWTQHGGREGGMNWEIRIDIYTHWLHTHV